MKKIAVILITILISACDSENAPDCFKKEGVIIQTEYEVEAFTKIIVYNKVALFLKEGAEQKIILETGENIVNDIEITVSNGTLTLKNNIGCNWVRDYGITKIYVTAPNIEEIRNSSALAINSIGVLRYPSLFLLSDSQSDDEEEYYTNGDFRLNLEVDNLQITANGLSNFFLSGSATAARIGLYAGDSRVEAADLIVQNLNVYHRSTNKMIVNPQASITGEIRSIGDVIAKNEPPTVDVVEYYSGRLIFE